MKKSFLTLLITGFAAIAFAQKIVHIPFYLQNPNDVNGAQFTWSKTAQSENFILIWGNTVGTDPDIYPDPNLAFLPSNVLDTMEMIYANFKLLGFLDDSPGTNLAKYKVPIVIYGTWGPNGAQGFANGGDADGIIGAFWVHPNATRDGGVIAHEFAHSLQAQNNIDYRNKNGLGYSWLNAGIFWETHANFMRNLLYPQFVTAWGMDVFHYETWGDWKNTYENYALLMAVMESEGIQMVNRLWRESLSQEYPLQAYKRIAGYSQAQFNDSLYQYARRMATYDFPYNNLGHHFRQKRNDDLNYWLAPLQNVYSILRHVPGAVPGRYEIPIEQAPEEYAYNVVPLYPDADSCAVIVRFKGHTETNAHAGWRYGFVAAHPDGTVSRYSPTYSANTGEIHFRLQGGEAKLFLVVMGAPHDQITTNPGNDTWKGYPKHFRFPYELTISGAVPEGHQSPGNFRAQWKINGHIHANGGGWVQNSANVASSVFVGPSAMVLGNSNISGQVRIEGTAVVRDAVMSGSVQVSGNAFVDRGTYSDNAVIRENAFVNNAKMSGTALVGMRARVENYILSGTVEVGGDVVVYNDAGNCNNGVHYRLTNYYDNKFLECDGRTATHPDNLDVNNVYGAFSDSDMALNCTCGGTTAITVDSMQVNRPTCSEPASGSVQFFVKSSCPPLSYAWQNGTETGGSLSGLAPGDYTFTITDGLGKLGVFDLQVPAPVGLSASVSVSDVSCFGLADGGAAVTDLNGTPPFDWLWSSGATDSFASGLNGGSHTVSVMDANGCAWQAEFSLHEPQPLVLSLAAPDWLCPDALADISTEVSGGTPPYTYIWSTGASESYVTVGAGAYLLTLTDGNGCEQLHSANLQEVPQISATYLTTQASNASAQDGTIVLMDIVGGLPPYTYLWSNGETLSSLQNIFSGDYQLTISDALGCEQSYHFTVSFGVNANERPLVGFQATLAPNPSAGGSWLFLSLPEDGDIEMTVMDLLGRVRHSLDMHLFAGENRLPLPSELTAGVYWVKVKDRMGRSLVLRWCEGGKTGF